MFININKYRVDTNTITSYFLRQTHPATLRVYDQLSNYMDIDFSNETDAAKAIEHLDTIMHTETLSLSAARIRLEENSIKKEQEIENDSKEDTGGCLG